MLEFSRPILFNIGLHTLAEESGCIAPDFKATVVYSLALQVFNCAVITACDPCLYQYKTVALGLHFTGIGVAMMATKYFVGKKDVDKLGFIHFVSIILLGS